MSTLAINVKDLERILKERKANAKLRGTKAKSAGGPRGPSKEDLILQVFKHHPGWGFNHKGMLEYMRLYYGTDINEKYPPNNQMVKLMKAEVLARDEHEKPFLYYLTEKGLKLIEKIKEVPSVADIAKEEKKAKEEEKAK